MKFEIKLPLFEGPFDLLLFFIQRDELDVYDIPISKITNDFLEYVKELESMNVEVASEFILVASTLMRIKAKLLLPRQVVDEEGVEIDPREELVRHLLEYKRYKSVVAELMLLESDRLDREKRGNLVDEIRSLSEATNVESELQNLDLFKILKVYRKVIRRYEVEKDRVEHSVVQYAYTISGQKAQLLKSLDSRRRVAFTEVIAENPEKIVVIFNFLAILELLQMQLIKINIGEGFNNFWIEKTEALAVE